MKTTLNKIRECEPCADGWEKLLTYLGKTKADDEPLSITTILDSNGLKDALWCLRAVEGRDKEIRLFAVWCARQVQHLMKDQRSVAALDVAERYANDQATNDELAAIRDAAMLATNTAAWSARAAQSSAWWAAWGTAWGAAEAAARATWSAAMDATWDAARAAVWDAARAAGAAWDTARVEMLQRQEAELRRICEEG